MIKPYISRIVAKSALYYPFCRILAVNMAFFSQNAAAIAFSLQFPTST